MATASKNGGGPDAPSPDGMILNPGEKIPTPPPAAATRRATKPVSPQSRYTSSNPNASAVATPTESRNSPPGFIGPVGYDVGK